MWNRPKAQGGRLLRVLLLWERGLSAYSGNGRVLLFRFSRRLGSVVTRYFASLPEPLRLVNQVTDDRSRRSPFSVPMMIPVVRAIAGIFISELERGLRPVEAQHRVDELARFV